VQAGGHEKVSIHRPRGRRGRDPVEARCGPHVSADPQRREQVELDGIEPEAFGDGAKSFRLQIARCDGAVGVLHLAGRYRA